MTILTCLDIEMPALAHKLWRRTPTSCWCGPSTEKRAAIHRVFGCARCVRRADDGGWPSWVARAAVPRTHCTGGASVFIPCEEVFGHTGAFAEIPAFDSCTGAGRVLYVQESVGAIRAVRHGKPGSGPALDADKVKIGRV